MFPFKYVLWGNEVIVSSALFLHCSGGTDGKGVSALAGYGSADVPRAFEIDADVAKAAATTAGAPTLLSQVSHAVI